MGKSRSSKRPKTSAERFAELSGELSMLTSDLRNFEHSGDLHWISSISGRLHKLLIHRRRNIPLLTDLAKQVNYQLGVYVSNVIMADLASEKAGRPKPIASIIPNILSTTNEPFYATKMNLEDALDLRCLVLGGREFTFREIVLEVRDTEGHHSDRDRPTNLDRLDQLEFPYGLSGSDQAIYHLASVVASLGRAFVSAKGPAS